MFAFTTGKWPRVLIGAVALACAAGGASILWRRGTTPPAEPPNPLGPWSVHTVEELTIEAPFAFERAPDASANLPSEIREQVEQWQMHEGVSPSSDLRAQVSHITYRDGVALDLDGAVAGAMSNAAGMLGDEDPKYTTTPMQLSGLDARRSSYRGKLGRQPIAIDAIFISHGQEFWHVQAVSTSTAMRLAGERLLRSVRLEHPPEPAAEPIVESPPAPPGTTSEEQ